MRLNVHVICVAVMGLTACSAPNHIGNPLTLPVRGLISALENASYAQRRARVKYWITAQEAAMRAEGFDGPVTSDLLTVVPDARRAQAQRDLEDAAKHEDFTERATVIIMVLGG